MRYFIGSYKKIGFADNSNTIFLPPRFASQSEGRGTCIGNYFILSYTVKKLLRVRKTDMLSDRPYRRYRAWGLSLQSRWPGMKPKAYLQ